MGPIRRIWRSSGRSGIWPATARSPCCRYGGGERVCLGKALAELEIRLLAVGLLKRLTLELEPDQDLTLRVIPSPSPKDGLLVRPYSRASVADPVGME